MLYEINTKDRHDKIIKEMLKRGYAFPNKEGVWDFEKAKKIIMAIANCYCTLFTMG